MRVRLVVAFGAALAASAPGAAAGADGVYGRLDGDLELRAEAGVSLGPGKKALAPSLAAGVTALYLGTAGVYARYGDALGTSAPAETRSIAAGVHLQPLFLARFANNLERGPAHLDLFLDSFALLLGAFWSAPRGHSLSPTPGLELGVGLGIPILPRATGPFIGLRGAVRIRTPGSDPAGGPLERAAYLAVTFEWRHVIASHLVDANDRAPR
jgi:hypothetical protein